MATAGILLGCCCGSGGVSCCANATVSATFTLTVANTIHFNDTVCSEQYGTLGCISGAIPAINTGSNYITNTRNAVTLNNTIFNRTITLNRAGNLPGVDPWCYYVALHPNNGTNICAPTYATGSLLVAVGGFIYQFDPLSGNNQPFDQYIIYYYATPFYEVSSGTTRWEAGVQVNLRQSANTLNFAKFYIGSIASNITGCPNGLTYIPSGSTKNVDNYHGYCRCQQSNYNCAGNSNISDRSTNWVQYSIAQPTLAVTI